MKHLIILLVASWCVSLSSTSASQTTKAAPVEHSVSDADRNAIAQAIEDEIYDWGCQKEFEFIGESKAGRHEIRVYIKPQLSDGWGEIIYKFMPFGEVIRSFAIGKSGTAYLEDTPQQGFGPERPNFKTVYMDDDDLLKDKEQWLRATFVIDEHPDGTRLHEARIRQHKRLGEMDYGPYKDCPV